MQLSKLSLLATYTVLSLMNPTLSHAAAYLPPNTRTIRPVDIWYLANPQYPGGADDNGNRRELEDLPHETITGLPSSRSTAAAEINDKYHAEVSYAFSLFDHNEDEAGEATATSEPMETFYMWITSAANPDVPYSSNQQQELASATGLYDIPGKETGGSKGSAYGYNSSGSSSVGGGGNIGMAFLIMGIYWAAMICYIGF